MQAFRKTLDSTNNPKITFVFASHDHLLYVDPAPANANGPFTGSVLFEAATQRMGLHPYPTPVAVNSRAYNGGPGTSYCAWMGGFGPFNDERWHPGLTWAPEALATGNFDLRTLRLNETPVMTPRWS